MIGTSFSDVINGNASSNKLVGGGGSDTLDARDGGDLIEASQVKTLYLDFDSATDGSDHVYSQAERLAIQKRIADDYALFGFDVTQSQPTDRSFVRILFNEPPLINGIPQPGGRAQQLGWRVLDPGGLVVLDINRFFSTTGNGLKPSSENIVELSATIAAHEIGHQFGLRHHDAFGTLGAGIIASLNPAKFLPTYPGPLDAIETENHLLASPASLGTTLIDALSNPFFGEREAIKLAFADTGTTVGELNDTLKTNLTINGNQILVQDLGALPDLYVPNTLLTGARADSGLSVSAINAVGTISLNGDGRSESDFYRFTGQAGDRVTVEIFSASLERIGNSIDSVLRLRDAQGNSVPYYSSSIGAFNDDGIELSDSILLDVVLPADGAYFIEVDTFSVYLPEIGTYVPQRIIDQLISEFPDGTAVTDTDTGSYELFIYASHDGATASTEPIPGDILIGGNGNDTIIGSSGNDQLIGFNPNEDVFTDPGGTPVYSAGSMSLSVDRAALIEGDTVTLTGHLSGVATVIINWGDGTESTATVNSTTETFSASHTFANDSAGQAVAINVTATASDSQEYTGAVVVTVADAAPTALAALTAINGTAVTTNNHRLNVAEGSQLTFTGSVADHGIHDTFSLSWEVRSESGSLLATGNGASLQFTPPNEG
ncbi:MAG: pre-peptidase C-terminal domain-containing protein, partial [Planctomycetaceae bacterium]|nr:pre-peptidase C-terminal domain-containing protein [Planctomycetaceae bacterium]